MSYGFNRLGSIIISRFLLDLQAVDKKLTNGGFSIESLVRSLGSSIQFGGDPGRSLEGGGDVGEGERIEYMENIAAVHARDAR